MSRARISSGIVAALLLLAFAAPAAWAGVTLGSPTAYATGNNPLYVAVGDLNGDGLPDLATSDNSGGDVTSLLNKGAGAFQKKGSYAISGSPGLGQLFLGPFLGTGHLDAAVFTSTFPTVFDFLPGGGDGSFGSTSPTKLTPAQNSSQVDGGPLTSDGRYGLVVADSSAKTIDVWVATGNGTFGTEPSLVTSPYAATDVAIGDVNGDGIPDVVAGDNGLDCFLGNGNGTFQAAKHSLKGSAVHRIALADFNGDGHLDVGYADGTGSPRVGVFLGAGDCTFSAPLSTQPTAASTDFLSAADLDSDGRPDLVASANSTTGFSIYLGNGDGTLAAPQTTTVESRTVTLADLNGDRNPDLAVAGGTQNKALVYLSTPPTASLSSTSLGFGDQVVGAAGMQTLALTNTSAATLPYVNPQFSIEGDNASDFSVSGCSTPVAPGATCTLSVAFTPSATGSRTASLRIVDNAVGGGWTVPLSGTGLPAPLLTHSSAPILGGLSQAHKKWREGRGKKKGAAPTGTTFKFTLNEAAQVKMSFAGKAPGRRVGKKCVAPTAGNAKRSRCSRAVAAGVQTISGKAGSNSVAFNGKVGGKKLKLGTYTVTIVATNAAGQASAPQSLTFTIVP